eukprot:FR737152.1.p1 GENE.FR737152.1~~FR737152.1.p1  ORF type:complete len:183 (+),score=14.57 FR737152.1:425-973(+)
MAYLKDDLLTENVLQRLIKHATTTEEHTSWVAHAHQIRIHKQHGKSKVPAYHELLRPLKLDDTDALLSTMQTETPEDQMLALQVMVLAAVIDGKWNSSKAKEITKACEATKDLLPNMKMIKLIAEHFRVGKGFVPEELAMCILSAGHLPLRKSQTDSVICRAARHAAVDAPCAFYRLAGSEF